MNNEDIVRMARHIVEQVRFRQSRGHLPEGIGFAELHDHFDANVGWSEEIDNLGHEDWVKVQSLADHILKNGE